MNQQNEPPVENQPLNNVVTVEMAIEFIESNQGRDDFPYYLEDGVVTLKENNEPVCTIEEYADQATKAQPGYTPDNAGSDMGQKVFDAIYESITRIRTDEHITSAFQKVIDAFTGAFTTKVISSDDPEGAKKLIQDFGQEMADGILDIVTTTVTLATFEGIGFYNDYMIGLMQKQSDEFAEIMNEHMSFIQALQMKISDLEKNNITKDIETHLND